MTSCLLDRKYNTVRNYRINTHKKGQFLHYIRIEIKSKNGQQFLNSHVPVRLNKNDKSIGMTIWHTQGLYVLLSLEVYHLNNTFVYQAIDSYILPRS